MVPHNEHTFSKHKHLKRGDIKCTSGGLLVSFHLTKTIQFVERVLCIPIPAFPGSPLCPLSAFESVCKHIPADSSSQAFFYNKGRKLVTLTYSSFFFHLRRLLKLAGINPDNYSGHSFWREALVPSLKMGYPQSC